MKESRKDFIKADGTKKNVILIQPGPMYLFMKAGVFYYSALKKHFDFVFIVKEEYENDYHFNQIIRDKAVVGVWYEKNNKILSRHRWFCSVMNKIKNNFYVKFFLLHDQSYEENQYIIHLRDQSFSNSPCYFYQSGRMAIRWESNYELRYRIEEGLINRKNRILVILNRKKRQLKGFISFVANYKLMPYLLIGKSFTPPVNVYSGKKTIYSGKHLSNIDRWFFYLDVELEAFEKIAQTKVSKIRHPMVDQYRDVYADLYKTSYHSDLIAILPSYGLYYKMKSNKDHLDSIVDYIAAKWCDCISKARAEYPNYKIAFKSHPNSFKDKCWNSIVDQIKNANPDLNYLESSESAEELIYQSKVVISDVSTTIWWAALLGEKIVISLDVFNYEDGDEYLYYDDLVYVMNNLEEPLPQESLNYSMCTKTIYDYVGVGVN